MDRISDYGIRETDEYEKFRKLLGNREVTPSRLSAIKESILRIGYQPSPMLVNERFEVVDGQGRLAACESLNIPVLYIIKKGLTIDDCISMNIKMKNWNDLDYIKCWADRGNENYINLCNSMTIFPLLKWNNLMNIVGGGDKSQSLLNRMRNGKLQFSPLTYDELERARWISAIIPFVKVSSISYRMTVDTLIRLDRYKLIDKTRMLEQFEKYSSTVNKASTNVAETVAALEDLYNYNRRIKEYFTSEYKRMGDEACGKKGESEAI